jgi:hypothetical protein
MGNDNTLSKKGRRVATSTPAREKSPEDELLESFGDLIDEAAEKMTDKEFAEAAKKSTATLDRAIAAHSRRRGTA